MEGPLSRVKSLKKSLRQSFRRIRKSRVSGKKRAANANSKVSWSGCLRSPIVLLRMRRVQGEAWGTQWMNGDECQLLDRMVAVRLRRSSQSLPLQLLEANAQLAEQPCPHDVEMTPVQRRIEPRSADDSLSGVVRCLYFADTFLRDGESRAGIEEDVFCSGGVVVGLCLPGGLKVLGFTVCWAVLVMGMPCCSYSLPWGHVMRTY